MTIDRSNPLPLANGHGIVVRWTLPRSVLCVLCFLVMVATLLIAGVGKTCACLGKADLVPTMIGPNASISQAMDMYRFHTGQWAARLSQLVVRPGSDAGKNWQ